MSLKVALWMTLKYIILSYMYWFLFLPKGQFLHGCVYGQPTQDVYSLVFCPSTLCSTRTCFTLHEYPILIITVIRTAYAAFPPQLLVSPGNWWANLISISLPVNHGLLFFQVTRLFLHPACSLPNIVTPGFLFKLVRILSKKSLMSLSLLLGSFFGFAAGPLQPCRTEGCSSIMLFYICGKFVYNDMEFRPSLL